jgi:hypothetical protein
MRCSGGGDIPFLVSHTLGAARGRDVGSGEGMKGGYGRVQATQITCRQSM